MKDEAPERIWVDDGTSPKSSFEWRGAPYPESGFSIEYVRADLAPSPAPEITEEMVERAIEAALPELQRREALMADAMTLDRIQAQRIVRAALTAALATQEDREDG